MGLLTNKGKGITILNYLDSSVGEHQLNYPNNLEKKGDCMADKNITDVTDENFKIEILDSTVPALVDFWAAWCGPCRAIAPVVEELAGQYEGQVKIGKCNVDENPKIPGQYGIRAIPTLILFKNGTVAEQITGAVSKTTLENAIKKVL
jgi:thioredoxin 1